MQCDACIGNPNEFTIKQLAETVVELTGWVVVVVVVMVSSN